MTMQIKVSIDYMHFKFALFTACIKFADIIAEPYPEWIFSILCILSILTVAMTA